MAAKDSRERERKGKVLQRIIMPKDCGIKAVSKKREKCMFFGALRGNSYKFLDEARANVSRAGKQEKHLIDLSESLLENPRMNPVFSSI
jgi:hypothetical protein